MKRTNVSLDTNKTTVSELVSPASSFYEKAVTRD